MKRCLKYSNIKRKTTHSLLFWKKGEEGRGRGVGHKKGQKGKEVSKEGGGNRDRDDDREPKTETGGPIGSRELCWKVLDQGTSTINLCSDILHV